VLTLLSVINSVHINVPVNAIIGGVFTDETYGLIVIEPVEISLTTLLVLLASTSFISYLYVPAAPNSTLKLAPVFVNVYF
jgi:hypothetical protein